MENINSFIDYTNLKIDATEEDIKKLIETAYEKGCASVCINPSYVAYASDFVDENLKICTVVGFPNGYNTYTVKCSEADYALTNGADEIDMVINICDIKNKKFKRVKDEIAGLNKLVKSYGKILKVIIETCKLTDEEIVKMVHIINSTGADFVKTSTGFSDKGAEFRTVELIKNEIDKINPPSKLRIKASGVIRTLEDAKKFIELGCDRLGCSTVF